VHLVHLEVATQVQVDQEVVTRVQVDQVVAIQVLPLLGILEHLLVKGAIQGRLVLLQLVTLELPLVRVVTKGLQELPLVRVVTQGLQELLLLAIQVVLLDRVATQVLVLL